MSASTNVKSMTSYAKVESSFSIGTFSWEIRSVNHRYLEILPKMPDFMRFLELPVRETIKSALGRGKVDVFLSVQLNTQADGFEVNQAVLQPLAQAICTVQQTLMEASHVNPVELLQWPGVLTNAQQTSDIEEEIDCFLSALKEALAQLNANRLREGNAMAEHINQRLNLIDQQLSLLKPLLPLLLEQHIEKLKQRVHALTDNVDQDRIHQEIAILAQKADIDEEMDRLITHLQEVKHTLQQNGPIGRRLDFLMQELNREANTLGSKAIDSQISQTSVELKVLIEQMREQVQNIE